MNVTLPDGTTLTDVPEGTTKAQLRAKLAGSGYDVSKLPGGGPSPEDAAKYDPRNGMSGGEAFLVGMGSAADKAVRGIKGLFGSEDKQGAEDAALYQKYHPGGMATAGEIAGDVMMTAAPAGGLAGLGGKVASMLPRATLAGRTGGALANAATQIGGNAGMAAAMAPEDRGAAALGGAAGAGLGMGAQRLAGGLVKPLMTPEAEAMMAKGMHLTPGQAMGPAASEFEQKLTSLPLTGASIAGGRGRALNESFKNTALDVVGDLPANVKHSVADAVPGNATMTAIRRGIGSEYERGLSSVDHIPFSPDRLVQHAQAIVDDPTRMLNDAGKKEVMDFVQGLIARGPQRPEGVTNFTLKVPGQVAKDMESTIGQNANEMLSSSVTSERKMGKALQDIHQSFRDELTGALSKTPASAYPGGLREFVGAPVKAGQDVRKADAAWRAFQPLDRASASMGAQAAEGVPQPRMLLNALKAGDKSQNDNALRATIAELEAGRAPSSPYEKTIGNMIQGKQVLGNTVADSGTAGRLAAGSLPSAVGMAGWPIAAMAYSRVGSKLLTQGMQPQVAKDFVAWAVQKGIAPAALEAQLPNALAAFGREQTGAAHAPQ